MREYGQFCPVAQAMEVIGERWTLLVIRELLAGSSRFSEVQRGVPLMSKSMLSQRLKSLIDAGVVERGTSDRGRNEYTLTPAGEELRPIVMACGTWGLRWARRPLDKKNVDVGLLMWDMRRRIAMDRLPQKDVVVQFEFRGAKRGMNRFWLIMKCDEVDLCISNPGRETHLQLKTDPATFAQVWMGELPWSKAVRSGAISLEGPRRLARAFPGWLKLNAFAGVERP